MKTSQQNPMLAKAWVSFTSVTTTAIHDSFNVTSLTDNGTGNTTINFTNAMANANYVIAGTAQRNGTDNSDANVAIIGNQATDITTTEVIVGSPVSSTSTLEDMKHVSVVIFGDA